ncbi:septin-10 isoform X1 [Pseudopipra pipra]|uniref:septin-10 isoform X1 n=1 Tax=Pseudopipra pipra TaxID=415032 RepID=UPI003138B35C
MPVVARARQSRPCPRPSSRRLHARQSLPRQRHRAALRPGGTAANARLDGGAGTASPPRAPPRRVAFAPRRPLWPSFSLHTCFPHFFPASPGEAMAASDAGRHPQNDDYRTLSLSAHVGFDSLPDQLIKKSIKQGFSFNVLCIGETGIGKSALINSLFNSNFEDPPSTHFLPSVQLRTQTYELQESDVLLKLTIVNTVGFGDQMNKRDSYQPVVDYIDAQFEAYLQEELKIIRSLFSYHDTRIHVCLYFISPTGRSLKTLDLLTMRSLDSKVNIIPVIGKADSISKTELQEFKSKIMSELVSNGIQIYQFPTDDETVSEINTITNGNLPFAVVGSMEKVNIGNKMVRARQYPWGIVKVENESHCDTVKLRKMLCTNMEDLREKTHAQHYELYRRCRLEEMGFRDIGPETKPVRLPCFQSYADRETVCHSYASSESLQEAYEAKRHEFYLELQRKEEEIKKQFVQRVKEEAAMLKEAEQEVQTKFECLMLIHQEEELKLEEKKKVLEDEIAEFIEKKATAELLQSQAPVSTPIVNLKRQGLQKNQDFQLELQCFDVRDEGTMNVQEQSKRESEEEELEREIHPGNSRNNI